MAAVLADCAAVRASALPFRVYGLEQLPRGACVIVVNHASYADGIFITAALSRPVGYIVKRELLSKRIPRLFLRRIGAEFVEWFEPGRGVADAARTRTLLFFAEGTFYRMPGLLPFHMGAFVAAAEAGVPVVPCTLRGTRTLLRSDQWFPRRAAVTLTVGAPILPEGTDWAAALRLRDAARAEILRHVGEPDCGGTPVPTA